MFVAMVAFAISAFGDLETPNDRTEVINVADYDSFELQSSTAFSVSNPVNVSESGVVVFNRINMLDGYIGKVEAEERGSPESITLFPTLRKQLAEIRHLTMQSWQHRLSNNKILVGLNYDYCKS